MARRARKGNFPRRIQIQERCPSAIGHLFYYALCGFAYHAFPLTSPSTYVSPGVRGRILHSTIQQDCIQLRCFPPTRYRTGRNYQARATRASHFVSFPPEIDARLGISFTRKGVSARRFDLVTVALSFDSVHSLDHGTHILALLALTYLKRHHECLSI